MIELNFRYNDELAVLQRSYNGRGYYFSQLDEQGKHSGVDLGFEHWKIDTTNQENVKHLTAIWK